MKRIGMQDDLHHVVNALRGWMRTRLPDTRIEREFEDRLKSEDYLKGPS